MQSKYSKEKFTYVQAVYDINPHKDETHYICLSGGDNLVDYPGGVTTPTVYLPTAKHHSNIVLYTIQSADTFIWI